MNKNDRRRAGVGGGKTPGLQSYPENGKQLKNAASMSSRLPQGGSPQLAVQHQVVSPGNMHRGDRIQTEQIVFRDNICVSTYICL